MQYLSHLKLRTTCKPPLTNLATLLFKVLRLSLTSLELSSSKGMFGSQENEIKKREKRENCNLKTKAAYESLKMKVRFTKSHKGGLYSHTRCVKYQKYKTYMIILGTKWELYETRSFGSKSKGNEFLYAY